MNTQKGYRLAVFVIIACSVLWAYFPTLYFPPRADQVVYIAETAHKTPSQLIFGCYDLNRHRMYSAGDELLFRPLCYFILGTEQVLFGHAFWAYQLMGILAHLFLVWVLLELLWHLAGPWLGSAGAWLFALSSVNYELVAWPHLTSYIIMMAFMLLAIQQMIQSMESKELSWKAAIQISIYSLVACFIYETANVFVVLMAMIMMVSLKIDRLKLLVLMLPVIFYGLCSFYNYVFINHLEFHHPYAHSFFQYLWSIIHLTAWWLYVGLFEGVYRYVLDIRTMFLPFEEFVFKPLVWQNPRIILELLILISFSSMILLNRRPSTQRLRLVCLFLMMLLAYVAVIVAGRDQEMGGLKQAVRINTYFLYLFWVIVVLMAFSWASHKINYSLQERILLIIFVISSFILGGMEAKMVHYMGKAYSESTTQSVVLVKTLDMLIDQKGHEPDFSFYVDPSFPGNISYLEAHQKNDPQVKIYTFAELMYPRYFHPWASAKYRFMVP